MAALKLLPRIILGLVFLVFGLNGFFNFIPVPPMSGPSMQFMMALMDTGYMMKMVKSVEVISGAMLILGFATPLALVLLGPVMVNILAFHLFLDQTGLPAAMIFSALFVILLLQHRKSFYHLLKNN